MLGWVCKPQGYRGPGTLCSCEAESRSMSGNVCEVLDELTWKEPDGDWGLSTIEAFCKQHVERLWRANVAWSIYVLSADLTTVHQDLGSRYAT